MPAPDDDRLADEATPAALDDEAPAEDLHDDPADAGPGDADDELDGGPARQVPSGPAAARSPRARKRRSLGGALLAGALVGLRDALEDRPDDQEAAVVEAPGKPHDIDEEGMAVDSHDQTFASPPLAPLPSEGRPRHRRGAKR